ncbi:uncharacterized protein N7518_005349 [Penicillium psychrosexuale]|uniref:uncharacterized protein n=1 Tax=Penicillium psychrosexuale TaxID=1002107 RepID=UPI0025458CA3|nr:uncharacterized protein N7518_005349 [Penicillium psychrosexuale]KAJ5796809.1 hypothetical protein N7518_005349 [Penicillium psychrosexuale]
MSGSSHASQLLADVSHHQTRRTRWWHPYTGDLTQSGSFQELQDALAWLRNLPHAIKIVIAGNHELLLDSAWDNSLGRAAFERAQLYWGDIIYLENEEVTVSCPNGRQLKVYGSPYSPRHGNWAFQYPRNQDIWATLVPDGIDVLITHGPPHAHLDLLKSVVLIYYRRYGEFDQGSIYEAYERTIAAEGGLKNLLLTT